MINAIRYKLERKSRISAAHSAQFQSRKNALYSNARKATQEFVKSSASALDNVQATLLEMRAQEIPFEKYRDDFHVVITSNKVSLDNISTLYLPVWKALGQRRSEQLRQPALCL
ncbi:hypothetical protein BJ912DRAFT_507176 [Pholiota molesta]|nr:hypothetical protein BJ912DRAFT_507176 [Pholiota molesta]